MNYPKILQEVQRIAQNCGRNPKEITLIAVSKTVPIDAILEAHSSGCKNFGESRIQEALTKIDVAPKDIHWHLIGTLQKNKVNKALGKFSLIHSVDSLELAQKISEASQKANIVTPILIQVNTSGELSKHGCSVAEWRTVFDKLVELPNLELQGLMTIAPLSEDKVIVRKAFSDLRNFKLESQEHVKKKEIFKHLSMGMSHDFPIAIEEGATLLRIGSSIFGERGSVPLRSPKKGF